MGLMQSLACQVKLDGRFEVYLEFHAAAGHRPAVHSHSKTSRWLREFNRNENSTTQIGGMVHFGSPLQGLVFLGGLFTQGGARRLALPWAVLFCPFRAEEEFCLSLILMAFAPAREMPSSFVIRHLVFSVAVLLRGALLEEEIL